MAIEKPKGIPTKFIEAQESREARQDTRDARQDARTDHAWETALASSGRTVKMLYLLLAASMLANVVLMVLVFGAKFDLSADGMSVGGDAVEAAP